MNNNPKSEYLDVLQLFRGIAAMMVVLHHTISSIRYYHKIDNPFLDYIGYLGKFGVDFFFVLSGFIITYSAINKYDKPKAFSHYITNRLLRIYVPYLPIGIFMLVIYTLLPSFSNSNRDISLLTSLTLIPDGNPALSVAWTLSYELFFYLLFSISFFSKKVWNYFVLCWFLSIIICTYLPLIASQVPENLSLKMLLSPYNIDFIVGFILAKLVLKKVQPNTTLTYSVIVLTIILFFCCTFNHLKLFVFDVNLLFAIIAFLSIFIAINIGNLTLNKTSIAMLVGNATYSIYLTHNFLQMILIRLFPKMTSILNVCIALIIVVVLTSSIGYGYYLIFEKKVLNSIKMKLVK
jgi:peptidoglycan/LPS O-acetylase OafA/YrhL